MQAPYIQKAARWLLDRQNSDGGWGESCGSYMVGAMRGRGTSTPSQTAWALLALLSMDRDEQLPAVDAGLSYLLDSLNADGTWSETAYTGTGFPGYGVGARVQGDERQLAEKLQQGPELSRGFMIGYNLYRHYFPMLALAKARTLRLQHPKRR
jgi:squalene-hopene/tetraprenyl-beta-curcumene cyclase